MVRRYVAHRVVLNSHSITKKVGEVAVQRVFAGARKSAATVLRAESGTDAGHRVN